MTVTADRLERAMRQRGWDQAELARRVGATQGAISKILVGKTANSRLMPRIAAQLGVGLPWLLAETAEEDDGGSSALLSGDELEWVELLRALDPKDRQAALRLIRSLATSARSPALHDKGQEFRRGG